MTKITISSFFTIFLISSLFLASQLDNADAIKYNTYYNTDYKFSIEYPKGWVIDDELVWDNNWVNVVAFYPNEEFEGTSVQLIFTANDAELIGLSSNQFLKKMIQITNDWCDLTSFDYDGFICNNLSIVDSITFENNMNAIAYTYTQTLDDGTVYNKFESLAIQPVGVDTYTILLETTQEDSFYYADSLRHSINSFQIIDNQVYVPDDKSEIPLWIKNVASWWGDDIVSDDEFNSSMKYLIENGILKVDLPNSPDLLFFQVVYYTSQDWCTSENYNEMMFYTEAAQEYLINYGYNPVNLAPTCLSIKGQDYYELNNLYDDVDLFITIRDKSYGTATLLERQEIWGYEEPLGNGQFVVDICACVVEIESQWGVMLLTHELSHFVIDHRGYPEELHESWVHKIHEDIDKCEYYYGTQCVFDQQGINYIDLRGFRYDVMPYLLQ